MSLAVLLTASRDRLRANLNLIDEECRVQPGPEPPPTMGDRFVAVYGTRHEPISGEEDLHQGIAEEFGIACGVTYRVSAISFDRLGEELYIKTTSGLENICRDITAQLHQSINLITAANLLISGTNKIEEYLRWEGTDAIPDLKDAAWFQGTSDAIPDRIVGLFMEVRLGQARRRQTLANIE